jgi:hypothetical protein
LQVCLWRDWTWIDSISSCIPSKLIRSRPIPSIFVIPETLGVLTCCTPQVSPASTGDEAGAGRTGGFGDNARADVQVAPPCDAAAESAKPVEQQKQLRCQLTGFMLLTDSDMVLDRWPLSSAEGAEWISTTAQCTGTRLLATRKCKTMTSGARTTTARATTSSAPPWDLRSCRLSTRPRFQRSASSAQRAAPASPRPDAAVACTKYSPIPDFQYRCYARKHVMISRKHPGSIMQ